MMNWQIVSIISAAVINIVMLAGLYYGLKADNAALSSKLDLSMAKEQAARSQDNMSLKAFFLDMLKTVEQNIKDLGARVATLEAGQDEWTKTLRDRTHELSGHVNDLVLKVDRLERPNKGDVRA